MKDCAVSGGPSSVGLVKKIARKIAQYLQTKLRTFPDGKSKLTVSIDNKFRKIVIVQSTHPPVDIRCT